LYNGCRNQIKIPESMILEITEKDMLVDVNRDQIVINRDEYQDLKNQIKTLGQEKTPDTCFRMILNDTIRFLESKIESLEAELKTLKSKMD